MRPYAYARAIDVMSTQSTTDFEWSVRLCNAAFGQCIALQLGIASQLIPQQESIRAYDQNAIMYHSWGVQSITKGEIEIHKDRVPTYKLGDVIRFAFQPQRKKLVIDLKVS